MLIFSVLQKIAPLYPEHLHNFVAGMVDDLDGNFTCFRLGEGTTYVTVQACPDRFIHIGF